MADTEGKRVSLICGTVPKNLVNLCACSGDSDRVWSSDKKKSNITNICACLFLSALILYLLEILKHRSTTASNFTLAFQVIFLVFPTCRTLSFIVHLFIYLWGFLGYGTVQIW